MAAEIAILKEEQIDERLDKLIRKSLCSCFPADEEVFSKTRQWHGIGPAWSVLIEEDGEVLAHVGIVDQKIRVGNEQIHIAGVQNVFVLPAHRARNFFVRIMKASMQEAKRLEYDCGFLFCTAELEKLYSLRRWKRLSDRKIIRVDQTGQEVDLPSKSISMYYPLLRQDFPAGDIHLQGNDW